MATGRVRSIGPTITAGSTRNVHQETIDNSGTHVTQDSYFDNSQSEYYKETEDFVSKSYQKRIREGEIISNPYSRVETTSSRSDVGWTCVRPPSLPSITGKSLEITGVTNYPYPDPHLGHEDAIVSLLRAEAQTAAKARANQPTFSGSTFIGEFRKTVSSIRNPINGIRKLYEQAQRKAARGKNTTVVQVADAIASSWLEGRYAWRPLMIEAEDAVEAYEETGNRFTARASRSDTINGSDLLTNQSLHSCSAEVYRTWTHGYKVRCGVLFEVSSSFNRTWGMRIRDIPATAWELLPYSFVLDWVINIGSYIDALVPASGATTLAYWTVVDRVSVVTHEVSPLAFNGIPGYPVNGSPVTATTTLRARSRAVNEFGASLAVRLPLIREILKGQDLRTLDSLALIYSAVRRSKLR